MKEILSTSLIIGLVLLVMGTTVVISAGSFNEWWGVRKTTDEYTTQYLGKPAIVKKKDVRFGEDHFYLEMLGGKISEGELLTDDNRIVSVMKSSYSVRDYNPDIDYRLNQR